MMVKIYTALNKEEAAEISADFSYIKKEVDEGKSRS